MNVVRSRLTEVSDEGDRTVIRPATETEIDEIVGKSEGIPSALEFFLIVMAIILVALVDLLW